MYPLFESIKISDGKASYLSWHQKRMDYAFKVLYKKKCKHNLNQIFDSISIPDKGIFKVRLLYNDEEHDISLINYQPKKVKTLKVIEDEEIDYSLKFLNRNHIEKLVKKKNNCDDIIIVKNGLVTDSSYSNIVFCKNNKWYTPSSPLLEGTARSRLLWEGKIFERLITKGQIMHYQYFKLINAMLDFDQQPSLNVKNIKS